MIYTMIIVACFGVGKTDCRNYEQVLTEMSANPGIAFIEAQTQLAQWKDKHPGVQSATFRLEPGRGA